MAIEASCLVKSEKHAGKLKNDGRSHLDEPDKKLRIIVEPFRK